MNWKRRTFLRTVAGAVVGSSAVTGSAVAQGNSTLVNAEQTDNGAIVATDDGFVISGQEIEISDQGYYNGTDGTYVVYNDGYSGEISDNEITVSDVPASPTFGFRIEGGDVDLISNAIEGDEALGKQFLSVGFADGATGTVERNALDGGHRVGILAEGEGTDVAVRNNEVIGLGPKSEGWAENGIQISGGANAHVQGNTVADHWWDLDNFQSSGIILFQPGDGVNLQRNTVRDNDAGIALWGGNEHNAIHNLVNVTEADPGQDNVAHYGVLVLDTQDSGVRQNSIEAVDGDIGILLYPSAENTKLIGNDISGFDDAIYDLAEDTKLPNPFVPDN